MTNGDDDGGARPGQVHVSELLAAHGRTVAPSGRRRRRAEPDEVAEPVVAEPVVAAPQVVDTSVLEVPAPVVETPVAPAPVVEAPQVPLTQPGAEPAPVVETPVAPAPVVEAPVVDQLAPTTLDLPDPGTLRDGAVPDVTPDDTVTSDDTVSPDADTTTPGAATRNPAREWAVVGAQLVGALVGGALLWFGFRWLWEWQSVVAFVLAMVVVIGLVLVVRVLRRAEDLFSTVLAVLAGLIVTVSPPVLTLTGR